MHQVFDDQKMFWIMTSLLSVFFTIICGLGVYIWKDNKAEKEKDRKALENLQEALNNHVTNQQLFMQQADFKQKQTDENIQGVKDDHSSIKRTLAYHGRTLHRHAEDIRRLQGNGKKPS